MTPRDEMLPRPDQPEQRPQDTDTRAHIERDRRLEEEIGTTLRRLSIHFTAKEIHELMHRVEASQSLDSLRQELSIRRTGEQQTEISDEAIQTVLDLIREAREMVDSGLRELRIDVASLNPTRWREIDPSVYPTSRYLWTQKLENSPLGKNILIDIAGVTVGIVDSVIALVQILLTIVLDVVRLPWDIMEESLKMPPPDKKEASEKR